MLKLPKPLKNILKRIGLVVVAGIVLVFLFTYMIYPAAYVNRVFRWGNADVFDYQKFPERALSVAASPYYYAEDLHTEIIMREFAELAGVDDFEIFLERNDTQAFLVLQDDILLYENYFNGASRESIVTSFSIAKSFTSALIGIAIEEGLIDSVHDPITNYIPELLDRDVRFENITIHDLLMMSSGIKYKEFPFVNGDDALTYYYPDLRQLALQNTIIIQSPGEVFLYNNYHPLLLGMILERATGVHVAEYLSASIWQPMGAEYSGSWSLDENGFEKMESGINGRAIDFAKFGSLYLNQGYWNGTQIVPLEWIEVSTNADTAVDYANYYPGDFIFSDGKGYYQYMWWGIERNGEESDFMALGNHGQFIYVSHYNNLLILRFGESYGEYGGAQGWLDLFREFSDNMDIGSK